MAEPAAALRILPSMVDPMWSIAEPRETAQHMRSLLKPAQGQIEFDLPATASEVVMDTHAEVSVAAKTVPQTNGASDAEAGALPVHDVQPARSAM